MAFKKKIIFRVIGNPEVGLGHVYRALSLASDIDGYEIFFIILKDDLLAISILKKNKFKVITINKEDIENKIISYQPLLVINDILNTSKKYVKNLKKNNIKVINFEDLGKGAIYTDFVINELYDKPMFSGLNIFWGSKYFFVRDEFNEIEPSKYRKKLKKILLTFGGTDFLSLSKKIYLTINEFCNNSDIEIYIVTGPGYSKFKELEKITSDNKKVFLTHNTGVISSIMKKVDLAITSNGRTCYELAHMNVPTLVISQHKRETTHLFTSKNTGFLSIGEYKSCISEKKVLSFLKKIYKAPNYRKKLYEGLIKYNFNNKKLILNKILNLLVTK